MASYLTSKSGRIFTHLRLVKIQLESEITSPDTIATVLKKCGIYP